MTPRVLLKLSGLLWVLPLLLAAIALTWTSTFSPEPGYALADQIRASEAMMLAYPVLGLGACVSSHRLHSSGILDRPIVRPHALARNLGPMVLAAVTLAMATALQVGAAKGLARFSWGLLAVSAAWALFSAVLGAVLGRMGPLRGTAPVSVLIPYVLVGFPPAFDPPWLRHVFGLTSGCCQIDQVLNPRMVAGAVTFMIGLTLLTLALWWGASRHVREALMFGAGAVALCGTAVAIANGLGYEATLARPGQPACQGVATTQVCVWPEHEDAIREGTPALEAVIAAANDAGLVLPSKFVETTEPTTWPYVSLNVRSDLPSSVLGYSLATSITPRPTEECVRIMAVRQDAPGAVLLDEIGPVTTAWLLEHAQVGPAPVGPGPIAEELLARLDRMDDKGAAFLRQWQDDLASCRSPAPITD